MPFQFVNQYDQMDCGPACLAMVANTYGKNYSVEFLREISFLTREGVSLLDISDASESIGFETFSSKLTIEKLKKDAIFPCILHWNQNHFVVLRKITKNFFTKKYSFQVADPGHGLTNLDETSFMNSWSSDSNKGVALFLNPTETFYQKEPPRKNKTELKFIYKYLRPYKVELLQLFIGLFIGSLLTLIFPFLTQALIDQGIGNKSFNIILIILSAQVFLFFGSSIIEIIRNWIMLYIGARINITIISDFLKKIMRLPLKFFDTKMTGDFVQRIGDHERIEDFLTSQGLLTAFSIVNFSVFFLVLAYYDIKILVVYLVLTIIAVSWATFFLKKRKILDYLSFQKRSENQDSILELINGMPEIKLNNFQDYKRSNWEALQVELFNINQRILRLDQYQIVGFNFINHLKNIVVTFLAASEVIIGNITLGALLSISYIIGQMNTPVNQLILFFRGIQDAKISLDRLQEIHNQEEEQLETKLMSLESVNPSKSNKGIVLENISFQYGGKKSPLVLKNIDLFIPEGKTTAIVGASGSGKTTLLKILLKFYKPTQGKVLVNGINLSDITSHSWRNVSGVVMQDGYIFADSIERNIATSDVEIDESKLRNAIHIGNLSDFIKDLPLGLKTKIGSSGNGISGGQKQRILIARAIYKNPVFLFFDEATSALDAENEKIIMGKLNYFFDGKTAVVIAHRLSTVKNADQIIVLKKGEIVEIGNHEKLTEKRGEYYRLVKNQLELGS